MNLKSATTFLGLIIAVLGAILAFPSLSDLLDPHAISLLRLILVCCIAAFGHFSADAKDPASKGDDQGPLVRISAKEIEK